MKIIIGIVSILFLGCATGKQPILQTAILESPCPKGVNCTLTLHQGKAMQVTNDQFGAHYILVDDATRNVLQYQHKKIVKGDLQDAGYREEVVFELPSSTITLENEAMQTTKMLFGRFCYCKGQTGYYAIKQGTLRFGALKGTLDFKISEVPQITQHLEFGFK